MKSNLKAVCHVSQEWKSEFQGIMSVKDKKSQFNEHWCKLKGNLLVVMKTADELCEELYGVVLMEYFEIEKHEELGTEFCFKIIFHSGDSPIILSCKSEAECINWKNHLMDAKNKSFTYKIEGLKKEVANAIHQVELEVLSTDSGEIKSNLEEWDQNDQSGLHIYLKCQGLPQYSSGVQPNASIRLYIDNTSSGDLVYLSSTEVFMSSNNPEFNKILFISEKYYDSKYNAKFEVFDNRDLEQHLKHKIGAVQININVLLSNSNLIIPLKNRDGQEINAFLKLRIEEHHSQLFLMELQPEVCMFHKLIENNLIRSYSFPGTQSQNIDVVEMMGECVFGLSLPLEYLKKLFEEESLVQESLAKFGSSDIGLENLRTQLHIFNRDKRTNYEIIFGAMSQKTAEGQKLNPSRNKNDFQSAFQPVNLHLHRMYIKNESNTNFGKFLDIVTVGAFTCHSLKNSNGLMVLAHNLPEEMKNQSQLLVADSMLRRYLHLVQDIKNIVRHICSFVSQMADLSFDLTNLENKMNKYFQFFDHQYFAALTVEPIRREYQHIIRELDDLIKRNNPSLQVVRKVTEKFDKSIESNGIYIINILWSKILNSLNSDEMIKAWTEFTFRENCVFSQLLASVVSGLLLAMSSWTNEEWSQMIMCGVPLYFEGLLSSFGSENAMLEDMRWAIHKLSQYTVFVESSDKAPGFSFRNMYTIELYCFNKNWKFTPIEVRRKKRVRLHLQPYFFNVGINEQQTLADRQFKNSVILQINTEGHRIMRGYYELHVKNIGNPKRTCKGKEIIDRLNDLKFEIERNRSKPVTVLKMAQEISQSWSAVLFTSCKSAKDRTSMSVTLQQTRWLKNTCNLQKTHFQKALNCIRATGLRRENCLKNCGTNKYSFNTIQTFSLPKKYKPPAGTYGAGET